MARPSKTKDTDVKEEVKITTSSLLDKFLKENKADHFNFEEDNYYQVSTGSFKMDIETGGGFSPGLQRFCGPPESGKSSAALEVMFNFLKDNGKKVRGKVRKRRGLYFKAEGRLSPQMRERSGIKFTTDQAEWEDGTCFVFESNIYETVCDLMKLLVNNNPEGIEYFFIVDSVDGLMLKNDADKDLTESAKVAGGPVVASVFMKKMSIPLSKRGHIAVFISQVRADIKLDPYSSAPIRQISATGGNALHHYANWIWEFGLRFNGDLILQNPEEKPDSVKNPILGHWVPVLIKKSPNEKSNVRYRYPIRYGRTGGRSVWVEKELVDLMLGWGEVTKAGAWYKFTPEFVEECRAGGVNLDDNVNGKGEVAFQGQPSLFNFVETREDFRDFVVKYFKELINGILNNQQEEGPSEESSLLQGEVGGGLSQQVSEES